MLQFVLEHFRARRAKLEATVRLMPIGLLTSWATPATSPPSAASRSASIRFCCAALSSSSALSAFSFDARSSSSVFALGDGVLAEHLHRAGHRADLVLGGGALRPGDRESPDVIARIAAMICCSGRRIDSAMRTPADRITPRKITAIDSTRREMAASVRSKVVLRLLLALAHLDGQAVDGGNRLGLAGIDGVAQQVGAAGELLGQLCEALAQRR